MKKPFLLIASIAAAAVVSLVVIKVVSFQSKNSLFYENVEVLADGEGDYYCTGPKGETISGHIICRCINTAPCKDEHGCN